MTKGTHLLMRLAVALILILAIHCGAFAQHKPDSSERARMAKAYGMDYVLFLEGVDAYQKNNNDEGRKKFDELIKQHPKSAFVESAKFLRCLRLAQPERLKAITALYKADPDGQNRGEMLYLMALDTWETTWDAKKTEKLLNQSLEWCRTAGKRRGKTPALPVPAEAITERDKKYESIRIASQTTNSAMCRSGYVMLLNRRTASRYIAGVEADARLLMAFLQMSQENWEAAKKSLMAVKELGFRQHYVRVQQLLGCCHWKTMKQELSFLRGVSLKPRAQIIYAEYLHLTYMTQSRDRRDTQLAAKLLRDARKELKKAELATAEPVILLDLARICRLLVDRDDDKGQDAAELQRRSLLEEIIQRYPKHPLAADAHLAYAHCFAQGKRNKKDGAKYQYHLLKAAELGKGRRPVEENALNELVTNHLIFTYAFNVKYSQEEIARATAWEKRLYEIDREEYAPEIKQLREEMQKLADARRPPKPLTPEEKKARELARKQHRQEQSDPAKVKAAIPKLKAANPHVKDWGLGIEVQLNEHGVELYFTGGDKPNSIAPLAGLPIADLKLDGTNVTDLSPLKGMKLKRLKVAYKTTDLSPLKGMPLEHLDISSSEVTDLSVIRNMPLKSLDLWASDVTSLDSLKGMRLKELRVGEQVTDISLLKGMPLERLTLHRHIKQFDALKGMKLTYLRINSSSYITHDMNVLSGMPLTRLDLGSCKISDLSVLKGMPLETLLLGGTLVSDLTPLKGMNLKCLRLDETEVKDISALKGMPLESLVLNDTRVADISALKGMKLKCLWLTNTRVKDITVLEGMPLKELYLDGTKVTEVWPLQNMHIQTLKLPKGVKR